MARHRIRCPAGGSSTRREVVDPAGFGNPAGSTAAIRYGTVVVVVVVVLVVVVVVHAPQTLPAPPLTPPSATQLASSWAVRARILVQSALASHAIPGSFEQVPATVPSPGVGSLHVPVSLKQQITASAFPQVDRAAQRANVRRTESSVKQPALRSAFR
ncbi:MAG: hypothetical protein E6J83_05955 [Deltaproteobacteria bacterium]|nr:MAG: hypothetical protein E6J83_05955 [Deltaproteobacteria bacterium]